MWERASLSWHQAGGPPALVELSPQQYKLEAGMLQDTVIVAAAHTVPTCCEAYLLVHFSGVLLW